MLLINYQNSAAVGLLYVQSENAQYKGLKTIVVLVFFIIVQCTPVNHTYTYTHTYGLVLCAT
jgi:hypothetical protein